MLLLSAHIAGTVSRGICYPDTLLGAPVTDLEKIAIIRAALAEIAETKVGGAVSPMAAIVRMRRIAEVASELVGDGGSADISFPPASSPRLRLVT